MFIFGFGKRKVRDYGAVAQMRCLRCSNQVSFHLVHARTWLTYFFIPIIPYRSQHTLRCLICGYGFALNKVEAQAAKQGELRIYHSREKG